MTEKVDVLVVGGGPAGLATAHAAAGGGRVLVVHRDREIGRPVRTSGGSWLKEIRKLGIPPHLYREMTSLIFAGPERQTRVRFGADRPVVLDVTGTYRYLADLATEAGVRIECRSEFLGVEDTCANRVTCQVSLNGEIRSIVARYVVDATGHRRTVLSSAGLGARPARIGIGAEIEFENRGDESTAVLFVGTKFTPAGYGWVFPTNQRTVRVGVGVIRPDVSAAPAILLQEFLRSERALQLGVSVGQPIEQHSGVIPSDGAATSLVHPPYIAVGDSVGQALPTIGEGIRYCIEAGRRAGSGIARALQQPDRESEHLHEYELWWARTYGSRFRLSQQVNERISAYNDAQWDEKIALLSVMDGDTMAAFLRFEVSSLPILRLAVRRPVPLARYALRLLLRKRL